jgi:hypothetical protein
VRQRPTAAASVPSSGAMTQPTADSPERDPKDWASGDEPATAAQLSYLRTLAAETKQELPAELTKAQASELIDRLRQQSPRVADGGAAS